MIYRVIPLEGFLNLEMIQVAKHIFGKEIQDLRKTLLKDDVLDSSSSNNLKRKVGILIKRFSVLDDVLVNELANADIATTEFITYYSVLKNEKLLYDFLNEVIFSNFVKLKKYITKEEVDNFMLEKSRQVEEVSTWTEESKNRMKNKVVEFSIKGGLLKKNKEDYTITVPSVSRRTVEHLKQIESPEIMTILLLESGN